MLFHSFKLKYLKIKCVLLFTLINIFYFSSFFGDLILKELFKSIILIMGDNVI